MTGMQTTAPKSRLPGGPTPRRVRWMSALGFAVLGMVMALFILDQDGGLGETYAEMGGFVHYIVGASAFGGGCGGLAVSGLLGRPGLVGMALSALAGLLATALGGAIGGTLVFPGLGTLFGPFLVAGSALQAPLMGLVWALCVLALHLYAARLRGQRPT